MKTIAIGSDHAGFEWKAEFLDWLSQKGYQGQDCGCHSEDSVDYPDFAKSVGQAIQSGGAQLGILICGTGVGISIAANKMKGIRAALCHNTFTAEMCRAHNNANILCMGSRVLALDEAKQIAARFLSTDFEGGRHQRRVDKIHQLES